MLSLMKWATRIGINMHLGATVLSGDALCGHFSVTGGNAWLTRSLASWSTVTMADPELRIRQKQVAGDSFEI